MKINSKLLISSAVALIAAGLIAFTVLTLLFPKDKETDDTPIGTVTSAKEIVEAFKKPQAVSGLHDSYSEAATPMSTFNEINYPKPNSYTTGVPASDFVQFEQKNAQQNDNSAEIVTATETFLTSKGLKKLQSAAASSVVNVFESEHAACQVVSLPKMDKRPASISIACADAPAIAKTYEQIDTLLALHAKAASSPIKPVTIQKVTVSEGNKTLTTLNVYGDTDTTKSLLFAAIAASWEYIGEQALSTGTTEGSQKPIDRTLSKELQAKINDPKYEGFLKKYVF